MLAALLSKQMVVKLGNYFIWSGANNISCLVLIVAISTIFYPYSHKYTSHLSSLEQSNDLI